MDDWIFHQIRLDQSLSRVRLFATPWIAARQASLSITNSRSSLRLMSIESVMPSRHLILCHPLLLLPPIPPSIRVFSNESTLESPLDCKEIQPVHPKGDQSWVFVGRTEVEAETPILWPPDANSWLIGKDPDAGKDWREEEKGMTEDEMVGWHHRHNGHEFEQTPGDGEWQGSLACCSPLGRKESDTTEWLNKNNSAITKCNRQTSKIVSWFSLSCTLTFM